MEQALWTAQDTTPGEMEAALRELLKERHAENEAYVPARVLNLVLVVDKDWRGEIVNRLERVGRFHPSRTVLCAVEAGRRTLDARATMTVTGDPEPGMLAVAQERVEIDCGPDHLPHLDTIVDPLVVTDLATVVWSPHGHAEALGALMKLAQVVLVDSVDVPEPAGALGRAAGLSEHAYVVDLAWLRTTPWRERISATFDPPRFREDLRRLSAVTIRHGPDSAVSGLLLCGWLASRLGWEPGAVVAQNGSLTGRARAKRGEVALRLEADPRQSVPGLAGLEIETASGMSISLDRGSGGLAARRRARDGTESTWTVMGASRGEAGILGEGIRQALLRDPAYRPALAAAGEMLA
ncbi:MAG: glucose-6-phosphate dehydrogenase assembly protein OpcA [Thermoleophilaceae bacterium]